jgi:hypothetical protein
MALTIAQKHKITDIFFGYFGRAPDPEGFQSYIEVFEKRLLEKATEAEILNTMAANFGNSVEAKALYPFLETPDVSSPEPFLKTAFQNLFNRPIDDEGLKFWSGRLTEEANPLSPGEAILKILQGAKVGSTDRAILDNKEIAALDFVTSMASIPGFKFDANANAAAKNAVKDVDGTAASLTAAKASTDAYEAGTANAGATFTLTTSTTAPDAIQGTDKADTINGSLINALQNGDVIDGKGGIDTLNATVAGTAPNAPVIVGVENINLTSIGTVTGLDATNWGAAAIGVTGTASSTTTIADLADGASLILNSAKHNVTVDPMSDTAKNALSVTLKGGGDHGTLTVHNGTSDVDALTLKSEGAADNTLTIGSAMNQGTGTTADPRETVVIEGTNGLTLKGNAGNLTGAEITATALAAGKSAVVSVADNAATTFSASRLTDVDMLSFSAATGSTIAMADVSGLADKQLVQLNNNATAGLKLSSKSATATTAATLNLANADIAGAITTDATFDIENITINSGGAANTIGGAVVLATDSGSTLTVTGDKDLTITGAISGPADKGVIDASALTGKFVMGTVADDKIETIKGGTGNDTLLAQTNTSTRSTVVDGGAGNDIITMSAGATGEKAVISVGAGDNTVTLSVSQETVDLTGGGKDTVQFVAGAATVDADVIIGFQTGTDKLSFNGLTGITVTSGTAVDASGAAIVVADDTVVTVSGGAALANATTVNAALATALEAELNFGASEESVVIYNDSASGNAFIYHIVDTGDATITAGEITLIGTVTSSIVAFGDIA